VAGKITDDAGGRCAPPYNARDVGGIEPVAREAAAKVECPKNRPVWPHDLEPALDRGERTQIGAFNR
jgi:hypothetical protein